MNETAKSIKPVDQFSWWRAAFDDNGNVARKIDTERGNPRSGYYRNKGEAIAFWREEGSDEVICWRSGGQFLPRNLDETDELFGWCAPNPVSYEAYQFFVDNGRWPEQVASVEVSPDLPPHEAAAAELKAQQEAARAWLLSLKDGDGNPRKPATQEEANKAANFGNVFAGIESKAEKSRKAEKDPHLEAGRQIDAKWTPIKDGADKAKVWAKKLSDDFVIAERNRRQAEADAENAKRLAEFAAAKAIEDARLANEERLRKMGVQVPEFAPAPRIVEPPKAVVAEPVRIGTTGRRQSLRTITNWEIDNINLVLTFLATRNIHSAKFIQETLIEARVIINSGIAVPGLKEVTTEVIR